jgi:TonB family protein
LPGQGTCDAPPAAIVMPADAPQWSSEDVERALVHELEHVRRRDWVTHCAARAVCALYWFHPLAWMTWRRLELDAERACDDAVLVQSEATAYADQLVAVAQRLSAGARQPALAMASRADLAARVNAVLDPRRSRGRVNTRLIAAAAIAVAFVVAAVSPLRVVAAPQDINTAPRLRAESSLVLVDATVKYPGGGTIEGLTANDFTLTEDGVDQRISIFEFHQADGQGYYLLGYYPRNDRADGVYRKIKLSVKTATTAVIDYRTGRFAPQPPEPPANATSLTLPKVDPGVRPPVLLFKKEPEYSEAARKAKYQGTVLLYVEVTPMDDGSKMGQATNIKVARSLGLGLDEKAIEAVKQWRFRPATKDGKPITMAITLEVVFRLL